MVSEFGDRIREAREKHKKWGLREASRHLKVAHSRLFELETGISSKTGMPVRPTRDNILKLAAGYGIPKEELFALAHFPEEITTKLGISVEEMAVLDLYRGLTAAKRKLWLSLGEGLRTLPPDDHR